MGDKHVESQHWRGWVNGRSDQAKSNSLVPAGRAEMADAEILELAPMAPRQPLRVVADERLFGALGFARNLILRLAARRRVILLCNIFRNRRERFAAVAMVADKPAESKP
jgi:hypothetical protein